MEIALLDGGVVSPGSGEDLGRHRDGNRAWIQLYLKQDEAVLEQLMRECAELQRRIKDARQRLAAMPEERTRDSGKSERSGLWGLEVLAGAVGAADVAAESSEAPEPASGVLQGVVRSGLWGEVLAGAVVESSAKLEDVVVRVCGSLVTVPLNGNRPAPKATAKAAANAGAPAAPVGRWFWSNLDTLVWIR